MTRWLTLFAMFAFAMFGMAAKCTVPVGDDDVVESTPFDVELFAYTVEVEGTYNPTFYIYDTGQCADFPIGSIEVDVDASGVYTCSDIAEGATIEFDFRVCNAWSNAYAPVTLDCVDSQGGVVKTGKVDLPADEFAFTGRSADGITWKLRGWL